MESNDYQYPGSHTQAFLGAKVFLQVIRLLLFGPGPPRYAQTPPLGGLLLKDFATTGAMVRSNNILATRSLFLFLSSLASVQLQFFGHHP